MSSSASILLQDRPAPGVTRLRLNRPEARNALNTPLRQALAAAFDALDTDDDTRCILLCGEGPCFAAGADIKEMAPLGPTEVNQIGVPRYWRSIAQCSKPVIAAVHGVALGGGCELALHADIILADANARFGQPEVTVGIMPGGGATQRLMRAMGKYQAMGMLLTGEPLSAQRAYQAGLVTEVVEEGELMERALTMATTIASRPPQAIRFIKEVALAGADASLDAGLMLERRAFEMLFDTADQKEGMQAFMERRTPTFTGA